MEIINMFKSEFNTFENTFNKDFFTATTNDFYEVTNFSQNYHMRISGPGINFTIFVTLLSPTVFKTVKLIAYKTSQHKNEKLCEHVFYDRKFDSNSPAGLMSLLIGLAIGGSDKVRDYLCID